MSGLLNCLDHALNEDYSPYGEWSNKFEWEIELENVNDGGVRDKGRVARAKGRRRCIMAKFEELDVWKRSARLSAELYKYFHTLKDYGFRDQITRSGLSIPSNIAEGYERDSDKDRSKFLTYSKGSCGELRTQIYIGIEIGYIDKAQGGKWVQETQELSRMLFGLMKYIKGE